MHSADNSAHIAVLLPAASGPDAEHKHRTFGPFDGSIHGSPWRDARSFVEENLNLSGGDPGRWVVCELTDPVAAAA